ncbi:MAG: glycosyltransferase family 4 protein [Bacteroidia bacterium]|nr:glycosyltransferase family 4 protein [Bacteroidia bacterium]
MKDKNLLIHAWTVHKSGHNNYLPYTHWVYLKEILKYYDTVSLLSPIKAYNQIAKGGMVSLNTFPRVKIIELPFSNGYAGSIKHFFKYYSTYKNLKDIDVFYARYPIPFGWLAKVFNKEETRIIHFVGDPVDATKNNPNIGKVKKLLMLNLFMPEHKMYLWACRDASVYTNGYHIAEKLRKRGINAQPLISSTLKESDYYLEEGKTIKSASPKLVYVGYLRKAKGVETLIRSFKLVQKEFPSAILSIIGTGEFETELIRLVDQLKLKNVNFIGHIDDRDRLNKILRNHDIFCFASLSEGSPRVVLEAMANGLAVVSTPVGSLPVTFVDNEEILFANFNDPNTFYKQIEHLVANPLIYTAITKKAYKKVQSFTIESFIKNIFDET